MIECTNDKVLAKTAKLFIAILDSGIYPKTWSHRLVLPICKHGNKAEPANYRGITINNSLSELFSVCMQKQVKDLLEKENIYHCHKQGLN